MRIVWRVRSVTAGKALRRFFSDGDKPASENLPPREPPTGRKQRCTTDGGCEVPQVVVTDRGVNEDRRAEARKPRERKRLRAGAVYSSSPHHARQKHAAATHRTAEPGPVVRNQRNQPR